jgi:hypothetical protein
MKNKIAIALAVLALGASAFVARAQEDTNAVPGGPPPGRHGHRPPPDALLKALDKNGDGKLTRDELRPARPPQDGGADAGYDHPPGPPPGDLQDSSNTNSMPGGAGANRHGHHPPPSPLFQALDTNHDGVIDADEIANAPAALKALDKNGDGKLTRDELRPARPPQDGGADSGEGRPPGPPPGDMQGDNGGPNGPPPNDQ